MHNIILIGFMGAGKTTVGQALAKALSMKFADTDELIAAEEGRSIPAIFAEEGEAYFRDLETALLERLLGTWENTVFSVGGGMPVREENRALLKALGTVVFLTAEKETILLRVQADGSRPMLNGSDLSARVDALMTARKSLYEDAAQLQISTDGKEIGQIAEEIKKAVEIIWNLL